MPHDFADARPGLFRLAGAVSEPMLALGGQAKARLALAIGDSVAVSDELGDLTTPAGVEKLEAETEAFQYIHGVRAKILLCDAHAGYTSAKWARLQPAFSSRRIFHHHAHASALAGEFSDEKHWLCFTWDAAGMGTDGTLWGGEALLGAPGAWQRVGHSVLSRRPAGRKPRANPGAPPPLWPGRWGCLLRRRARR